MSINIEFKTSITPGQAAALQAGLGLLRAKTGSVTPADIEKLLVDKGVPAMMSKPIAAGLAGVLTAEMTWREVK